MHVPTRIYGSEVQHVQRAASVPIGDEEFRHGRIRSRRRRRRWPRRRSVVVYFGGGACEYCEPRRRRRRRRRGRSHRRCRKIKFDDREDDCGHNGVDDGRDVKRRRIFILLFHSPTRRTLVDPPSSPSCYVLASTPARRGQESIRPTPRDHDDDIDDHRSSHRRWCPSSEHSPNRRRTTDVQHPYDIAVGYAR